MDAIAPDVVLSNVTKRFGDVTAVDALDLEAAHRGPGRGGLD